MARPLGSTAPPRSGRRWRTRLHHTAAPFVVFEQLQETAASHSPDMLDFMEDYYSGPMKQLAINMAMHDWRYHFLAIDDDDLEWDREYKQANDVMTLREIDQDTDVGDARDDRDALAGAAGDDGDSWSSLSSIPEDSEAGF